MHLKKIKQRSQGVWDWLIGAEYPQLYYQSSGLFAELLSHLDLLQQKYQPTPWLANTHVHLIYLDLIKKKQIVLDYDGIEEISMQDGGITAIAWLGKNLPSDTPTILILHTLTGTPDSMRELVKDLHRYTGWRIALCLRRGHAQLPLPVPKINLFGSTQDLKEQIQFIQQKFPLSDLYAVGSSAGTGLLVRYLGEVGDDTPIKAAFALCPGYNTETGFANVHPFYSKVMVKKLYEHFLKPYENQWINLASYTKVLKSQNLAEFELNYYEMAGFNSYEQYVKATNPIYVFDQIKKPLLILNALDDPICHIKNFFPYQQQIMQLSNVAVVATKKGSHCGFYQGWFKTSSWAVRLMADYFLVIAKNFKK